MTKEMFLTAHDELIEEYMEANPNVSWEEAVEICAKPALDRASDMYADLCDRAHDEWKDAQL